ncbi:thiamine transporter 2 [Nomia melanderi]|uniref:thiamine transporter 2 n=1 Tax=Nomia melanderi TaxID=2448451 RepID=UPI0013045361|nr:thiamine transporter 2-like [Nomia melanderi]XP_031830558.1 thiamine transporter 2-like [Nomia melanderi]
MKWIIISCILCVFGCFKEFRPSESFVTDYLTGPWKNFTDVQVNQEIFPISTYSYFATLIIVFLITDFVRYKPVIILCGLSGVTTFLLITLGKDLLSMQIVEFFYGLFLSTEIAYYTYIYAKVDKKHYQEVTSHTKAASLIGRCMSGIIAQLTVSLNLLNYHQLNYLTTSAIAVATLWAFFLPSVGKSIYFHRNNENSVSEISNETVSHQNLTVAPYISEQHIEHVSFNTKVSILHKIRQAYIFLWRDFLEAYSNKHVVKWSLWWAFSTCGYLQVVSYIQLLWQTAVSHDDKIYNGAVDSLYTIIGTITVFCIGKMPFNWSLIGDIVVSIMSFMEGILLLAASYSYSIWLLYGYYIVFGIIYHTMHTVASFEVAKCISENSYGLIFGVNTFFALLLQTVLTAIVVNGSLGLSLRSQYFTYGGYFIVIAMLYTIIGIFNIAQYFKKGKEFNMWTKNKDLTNVQPQNEETS